MSGRIAASPARLDNGMPELATFDIALRAHRTWEDGEPRWRDIDLAVWLDFDRDRNIRKLIKDNSAELERYGSLLPVEANSGARGGRPAQEFWLNFDQCAIVCLLSRSRYGQELRYVLLKVLKYLMGGGGLATVPRMALRALDVAAEQIIRPLQVRMDRLECKHEYVENIVRDLQRIPFSRRSLDTYVIVIVRYYVNTCPCCEDVRIIVDSRLTGAEADHWYGKRRRRMDQGWYICIACNRRLDWDLVFKSSKEENFARFQEHVKQVIRQPELPFLTELESKCQ
jgi:hypothetical protein